MPTSPQIPSNVLQIARSFLTSVGNALNIGDAADQLFDNLLAQARKDKPLPSGITTSNTTVAGWHDLLQRVRDERAALRDDLNRAHAHDDERPQDRDDVGAARDNDRAVSTRPSDDSRDKTNGNADKPATDVKSGDRSQAAASSSDKQEDNSADITDDASTTETAAAGDTQAETATDTSADTDTAGDDCGNGDILENLLQAEQMALGLLQRFIEQKLAAGTSTAGVKADVAASAATGTDAGDGSDANTLNLAAGLQIAAGEQTETSTATPAASSGKATANGATAGLELQGNASAEIATQTDDAPLLQNLVPEAETQPKTEIRGKSDIKVDPHFASLSAHLENLGAFTLNGQSSAAPVTLTPFAALQLAGRGEAGLHLGHGGDSGGETAGAGAQANAALPELHLPEGAGPVGSYSFASQLSAARAAHGGSTGMPSVIDQVVLQMNRNIKDGNGEMTIHLKPADLGSIDIKLSFSEGGKVHGTVVADHPATLDLLLKDVRSLERGLQEAGFSADPGSLQFSLRGDAQQQQNFGDNGGGSGPASGNLPDAALGETLAADAEETWYVAPGRVNMKV